jgi:hypothetical protein
MINKLARRLGFQQSVSVALIDDWHVPQPKRSSIELAPREGVASCLVDQYGRVQIDGESWTLDLTLAAGARWVAVSAADRVAQVMVAPGVVETTVQTPSGPVVQRVAAGVVDGEPVVIIEVENTGGVAIAAGVVARPLRLDGRGFIGEASADASGITIDGHHRVRFEMPPAAVAASDGPTGDLLQQLPNADDGTKYSASKCRSGGAQAAAVWPLPHTAILRIVVELVGVTSLSAAVPSTSDINRGWEAHLKQGMRVDVDEVEIAANLSAAGRSVLTLWPDVEDTPSAILAMSEMGFGRDAGRLFERLERCDDDGAVLRCLARWSQLGEQRHQLEDLDRILGRLAQAAHVVAGQGDTLAGASWLDDALVTLGGRLHQIEQPDVAERVQGFSTVVQPVDGAADLLAKLTKEIDKRGVWPNSQMRNAAQYVRAVRALVVEDTGTQVHVLPGMPKRWRGRTLDVFGLPIANGSLSFGLRWHGPRPALLWEATLAPDVPFVLRAPGIDTDFMSHERQGEALLADPGWGSTS